MSERALQKRIASLDKKLGVLATTTLNITMGMVTLNVAMIQLTDTGILDMEKVNAEAQAIFNSSKENIEDMRLQSEEGSNLGSDDEGRESGGASSIIPHPN